MNNLKMILAGFLALALQATVSAQIYESEDAEGVPDFSDTPTAGAEVVDLPVTNTMEPPQPEEPARAPQAPSPAATGGDMGAGGGPGEQGEQDEQGSDPLYYYGSDDDDDPRARRRIDEERVDNALPGESGVGAGAPDWEAESRPAEAGQLREDGAELAPEADQRAEGRR